ncbi:tyrosine-type recombinase/integrase [Pseudomonas aeruginosa]|uniref:tyrosine-type recombinase/integrase n=4 Tax=Pseudomonas aeruginosa TaxID=287 RepID=UPI00235890CA|nr:tyrosine-type recombinase/integrase [Pseudomonas aeruginosa]HEJ2935013.1 tyrosine-type recombinase/integrase [Pseudomonas aeruginosa]
MEAYYRRRDFGGAQKIKLGLFRRTDKSPGFSLSELRDKAGEYSRIAAEHGDVKAYLERSAEERMVVEAEFKRQKEEAARLASIEAAKGSFSDLLRDYIEDRRKKVTDGQIKEFERILQNDLEAKFPVVMEMKAKDVRPEHAREVLRPFWERGAKRQAGKVRSFLVAAFNFGLRSEHHIDRSSQKSFGLEMNPAGAVVVPDASQPGTRALSDEELKQLWSTITDVDSIGPIMARLFRFAVAIGGQRPGQIVREPWSSYDFKKKYVRLIDRKGRGGEARVHLVPLTDRAIAILKEIQGMQPKGATFPWSTDGKVPIHASSPAHALEEWLDSSHAKLDGQQIPKFTPKDLRRTCTQFMERNGIKDFESDALQSHGQVGVVKKHYRNDPESRLPGLRATMEAFDRALQALLSVPLSASDDSKGD